MKKIILNNEIFEEYSSRMHPVAPITGCKRNEIFEVYGRPSYTKVSIWEYWCNWCEEMNERYGVKCGIQIESHSCHTFTISGSLRYEGLEGDVYDLWITKSHNKAYKHWKM